MAVSRLNEVTQQFLKDISAVSYMLADAYQETIEYWAPELPPDTIAYAEVGKRLVDEFDVMDLGARKTVFDLIEEGMKSEDETLGTAVATGLIEGMVGHAARRGNWEKVRTALGPLSLAHADIWNEG